MSLTNDIRRLRQKINLFSQPGCDWVLSDIIDEAVKVYTDYDIDAKIDNKTKRYIINTIKSIYQFELNELLSKQEKYEQSKIKFKD
jgi:hypothetical protein